jgi:hypothetical protein
MLTLIHPLSIGQSDRKANMPHFARRLLPGIQALSGFQLIAISNNRFQGLTLYEHYIHFSSLLLVALAIALIMTPGGLSSHRGARDGISFLCQFGISPHNYCHDPVNVCDYARSAPAGKAHPRKGLGLL